MERSNADQNIRRYLLGEVTEVEQQQLEESLLTGSELFEELLIAEDELVDEYIDGRLTQRERERFEQHFLSTPERLQKLRFARAFKKHIAAATARESPARQAADDPHASSWTRWLPTFLRRTPANPILSFSLATALLLVIIAGLWVLTRSYRAPEIAANRGPSSSNVFSVTLTPGLVRDAGELKRVLIPPQADSVELRLELGGAEYESYRAMLQTDEGREIFTGDHLKPETAGGGKIVALSFPARLLANSDYQVKLSGINASGNPENVGRYYFRVVKG